MGLSVIYILKRFWERMARFFWHWYRDGFLKFWHETYNVLERFDYVFALKITGQNLFQPMFGDRSFWGYFLGFIFRCFRILIGAVVYTLVVAVAIILYITWASIPVFIIYKIVINL